jgi:hypothetical protein
MTLFNNIESVKRLYKEFLFQKWAWNNLEVNDSFNSIIVRTWLKQGHHIAIGNPMVLWKTNNYPKGYNHELDSLYGKIKQWFLVYWNNQ